MWFHYWAVNGIAVCSLERRSVTFATFPSIAKQITINCIYAPTWVRVAHDWACFCANFLVDCPSQLSILLVDFKVFCQLFHMTCSRARKLKNLLEYFLNPNSFPLWLIQWFCPDFTAIVSLILATTVWCHRKIGLGNQWKLPMCYLLICRHLFKNVYNPYSS